jgi:lipopolysaccharide/colanic/teichoic acid biosynthesis glycosyltransferase
MHVHRRRARARSRQNPDSHDARRSDAVPRSPASHQEVVAVPAGVVLPILAIAAVAIVIDSTGSLFVRSGWPGWTAFRLWKLRTMRRGVGGSHAAGFSNENGRVLRFLTGRLPQLWNVLVGTYLSSGRVEVPALVNESDELWRRVLTVRPGITDLLTLSRDERPCSPP